MNSAFQSHDKVSKSVIAIWAELGGKPNLCHEIFYWAVGVRIQRHLSLGRITTLNQSYTLIT